jgi:uncharacterized protein YjbI with pentapeptide repeats
MLLANENTSAMLSGVAALHQIAVEASQTEDQKDYVQVIKDILINFIREGSVQEEKDADGNIITKARNDKKPIVIQTIIDKLFKSDNWKIYVEEQKRTDLRYCVLKGVDFRNAHLEKAYFWVCSFGRSVLLGCSFERSVLLGCIYKQGNIFSQYYLC